MDAESPDQTPEKTSEETENTSDTDQMSIKINNKTTIHVKKDNFLYHSDTDTVSVKNEESFMQEINIVCDAKTGREAKLKDMRRKALPIIKEAIKSEQRKRSNSQIRKRSEEESEEYNPSKTVRKDSATPKKKKKKDKSFMQYVAAGLDSLSGKEPSPFEIVSQESPKSQIPAPNKSMIPTNKTK